MPIFDASSGLCQLCYGFSTGRFLFQSWASLHFVYYMFGVCYGVCFLIFGAKLDAIFTYGGSTVRVCTFATLLEFTHGRHMSNLVMVISPHSGMHSVAASPLLWVGGSILLLTQLFPSHPIYLVGHTALGAQQRVTWSLHLPYMMWRGLLFRVWCHQMTGVTLNLWWALNLVILVWWLGIRLMSLLTPGLQSGLLPTPTFILGSLVKCHH